MVGLNYSGWEAGLDSQELAAARDRQGADVD